ncbi:MAG: hypothetical protein QM783_03785 [Phycisphaerales bacterium]
MKKIQQLFSSVRNGLFRSRSAKAVPLAIAASAGKQSKIDSAADQSLMEQLEPREYLFVLTVDANDPTFQADPNRAHYGTVTINFAYFLPFLTSMMPTTTASAPPTEPPIDPTFPGGGADAGGGEFVARNRMAAWLEARMLGVQLTLYGRFEDDPNTAQVELPTSIQVFDLYGRDMQGRLDIGRESPILGLLDVGGGRNQINPDDVEAIGDRGTLTGDLTPFNGAGQAANVGDGVPDMNDGLGLIVFINSDANAAINLAGGQAVRITDQASFDRSDVVDQNVFYGIDFNDTLDGDTAWWDSQGFGFGIVPGTNPPNVSGLPNAGGSVVFGAPYIRDNTDRLTYFGGDTNLPIPSNSFSALPANPLVLNFVSQPLASGPLTINGVTLNSPIVGIRTLTADQAVGTINVPGLFMGTVNVSGSLGVFFAQHLLGSIQVNGDVGEIFVGGTSGYWVREDQRGSQNNLDNLRGTGSSITIGGRLGTFFVGGRNRTNVFVTGDLVNPRQRVEGSVYNEIETVFGVNPQLDIGVIAPTINTGTIRAGSGTYRNDDFSTAEFIWSGLSGTTVTGAIGLADPLNDEDLADFYAFAANAGSRVQFNAVFFQAGAAIQNPNNAYIRVYDQNGNLVATHQAAGATPADTTNPTQPRTGINFEFNAPSSGVYYMVVGTLADGQFNTGLGYTVTMAGQAATTLGQIVTGGGLSGFSVNVGGGAVGRVSGGFGVVQPDGTVAQARDADASAIPAADYADSAGFSLSVPTIYNVSFGADMGGGIITASGMVGDIQVAGSLLNFTGNFSQRLGSLTVGQQTGVQAVGNLSRNAGATGAVALRTGSTGVPGHIGRLLFFDLVRGDQFSLTTSPGSFVDDLGIVQGGFTQQQPTFNLGQGSDIRFASFPSVRLANPGQQDIDYFLPLLANTPLTLTDDSGVTFTVMVTGAASFGTMRVTPAGQLGGVIVGRIDVTLQQGGNLQITTTSSGSLALGQITVNGAGGGFGQSNVIFAGPAEIDVRQIQVTGTIGQLVNSTPDGDIVAADVGGVTQVIVNGSLGSTRTYVLSQQDIAARRALQANFSPITGTAIGVPQGLINGWGQGGGGGGGGNIFVPFVWDTADAADRTLEDSGSPIDNILNGIVIRTGNVTLISARGSIGDVITQGGNGGTGDGGRVTTIIANSDNVNTTGRFEGITGSIFVGQVQTLDVGDGILGPGPTPFAQAGVFATDDIISLVAGTRMRNPVLTGAVIIAANANPGDDADGIQSIRITGANLDRAFVHVANLDSWWRSPRYGDDRVNTAGTIQTVTVTNGSVIGTDFHARSIGTINITGGVWDSSSAQVELNIGTINADAFTSSLSTSDPLAYMFNQIRAGLDVGTVRVNNPANGDITDLFISAGRNNTNISARNLIRSNIDIRGNAGTMSFRGDVRASSIGSGRLSSMAVTGDIRSSTIAISGAILSLTAGGDITDTAITSSGPDGRINNLTAQGTITGTITSSGPIGTISTTRGDINVTISTTDGTDGNITTVRSGRDLILSLNMATGTTVNTLQAARNIGRRLVDGTTPDELVIPGNVTTITAGGVLYSDVRAGGTIGTITSGRGFAYLPTADYATDAVITASGRINTININGDFNGSIVSYSGGIGAVTITNGSFRAGDAQRPNRIEARDGDITSVRIVRGHLLGDILAPQGSISTISVTGDAVFGDIGVSPTLFAAAPSQANVPASERRTQLPPGAAPGSGPTIAAGVDIGSITTTGGVYEASISAGRTINSITVGRGIDNQGAATAVPTFIVAGDRINTLTVTGQARGTFVAAGVTGVGSDLRPGGTGGAADTVKSGTIGTLNFRGGTNNVLVAAGLIAGADGAYNTGDDQSAPGISTITSVQVTGTATSTVVRTDSGTPNVSANLNGGSNSVGGQNNPVADGFAYAGATPGGVPLTSAGLIVTIGGQLRRITFTGAGTATYSSGLNLGQGAGTLVLASSTTGSTIRIDAAPAGSVSVGNLRAIVGRDDASLGQLTATNVDVSNLSVTLDGTVNTVTTRNMSNSPVRVGQSLGTLTAGATGTNTGLVVESRGTIGTVRTIGGVTTAVLPASVQALSIGTLNIGGQFQGIASSDRDITTLTISGVITSGSGVRAGYNMGNVTIGSMTTGTVSAGGNMGTVRVNGNVTDSAILSGVDLGRDANFGGTGLNADDVSNGNMGAVTITGNFLRSDIAAGAYQGTDGFLGTQDDLLGEGRSTMGNVTINGTAQGSLLNTESYRIFSNGTMGTVRAQNLPFTSNQNLTVVKNQAKPDPLQVTNVEVRFIGGTYFATIFFNQPVDPGTLSGALSIAEIRGAEPIATFVPLVENADYTVSYAAGAMAAIVQFSQTVTSRDLDISGPTPQPDPTLASPGMFRFTIDSGIIRGQTSATLLDGDNDGVAETTDNWSSDFVVGDAGDRFIANNGQAADLSNIDFYGPVNLDVIMSRNATAQPDTADINRTYNIQGYLGDHPDTNGTFFAQGSDVDVYQLTMRAGQILQTQLSSGSIHIVIPDVNNPGSVIDLGAGSAVLAGPQRRQPAHAAGHRGLPGDRLAGRRQHRRPAPVPRSGRLRPAPIFGGPAFNAAAVVNLPGNAAVGDYTLSVRIVDDGDNGFNGSTDASDGSNVENAPLPSAFAGPDNTLGTQDDLASITVGQYTYRLDGGANNTLNGNGVAGRRSDDVVIGINQYGTEQTRAAGNDGIFGTADDVVTINGAIGERNAVGSTLVNVGDLDVYHLNAGQPIVAGQRYRFTLRVSEYGGDLGTPRSPRPTGGGGVGVTGGDARGQAQFALFETTAGGGMNSGNLVAQAPNAEAFRAVANTVVATDGTTTYGYDANGDFYMEITIPRSQADGTQNASFALYVQGAHQSNYTVQIQNIGTGDAPVAQHQNFLIEANGGVVNWLNAFGASSVLDRFSGSVVANVPGLGMATRAYILSQLINNLNNIFTAAGVDVRISLSSADFVGEQFSTVFLTDSLEPADVINQNFFGVSQRRDVLNADHSDQAVVFAPAITALGNTVDQPGIDSYVTSLTGSVVQRMGELLGLSFSGIDTGVAMFDGAPGFVNAAGLTPADFGFNATSTNLGQNLRSSFILGQQNDTQLLRRIFQLNT